MSRIWSRSSARTFASSAESGSSSNKTRGSIASARASATRCCWPPDSLVGVLRRLIREPHESPAARRRFRRIARCAGDACVVRRPRCHGRSCWERASNSERPSPCRASGRGTFDDVADRRRAPARLSAARTRRATRRAVVLPQPDGPRSATNSPGSMRQREAVERPRGTVDARRGCPRSPALRLAAPVLASRRLGDVGGLGFT